MHPARMLSCDPKGSALFRGDTWHVSSASPPRLVRKGAGGGEGDFFSLAPPSVSPSRHSDIQSAKWWIIVSNSQMHFLSQRPLR